MASPSDGHRGRSTDELSWLLSSFLERTDGVTQTVVVSSDGFLLATSAGLGAPRVEQLAAIISGLTSLTQGAADLYQFDRVRQVIVEMTQGFLFVMAVSDGSAIGTLADVNADVGAVGYEMTLLVEHVGQILNPELIDILKNALVPEDSR